MARGVLAGSEVQEMKGKGSLRFGACRTSVKEQPPWPALRPLEMGGGCCDVHDSRGSGRGTQQGQLPIQLAAGRCRWQVHFGRGTAGEIEEERAIPVENVSPNVLCTFMQH